MGDSAGFFGGILLANLSGKELLANYGILNSYDLSQYTCRNFDYDRLFCMVFLERIKGAFVIVVLGKLVRGKHLFYVIESALAAIFGVLMVVAISNLGVRGIAVILAGIFPQWIFYQMDIFLYAKCRLGMEKVVRHGSVAKRERLAYLGILMMLVVVLFAGIFAESYLNPPLFDKILKIF